MTNLPFFSMTAGLNVPVLSQVFPCGARMGVAEERSHCTELSLCWASATAPKIATVNRGETPYCALSGSMSLSTTNSNEAVGRRVASLKCLAGLHEANPAFAQ